MNMKNNLAKPLRFVAAGLLALSTVTPLAYGQSPSPAASPTPVVQMQDMNQMQGMMSDSMTKMSEMCMMMMQQEKTAMPYIIGAGTLLFLLFAIALVLLIVLEIQWIKYWSRILKRGAVQ